MSLRKKIVEICSAGDLNFLKSTDGFLSPTLFYLISSLI